MLTMRSVGAQWNTDIGRERVNDPHWNMSSSRRDRVLDLNQLSNVESILYVLLKGPI